MGKRGPQRKDRTGERFGKLTILEWTCARGAGDRDYMCLCACDCGVVKKYFSYNLTRKIRPVRSCGCLTKISAGKMQVKAERNASLLAWRREGMSVPELVKKFGITKQRVLQILEREVNREIKNRGKDG